MSYKDNLGYSDNILRPLIVKVGDLDTEAAFMQSLVPPKEERVERESSTESSQTKLEPEEEALTKPENENLDEKEQIETESQTESENEESDNSSQKNDSDSVES
jgi:hypothetical protein